MIGAINTPTRPFRVAIASETKSDKNTFRSLLGVLDFKQQAPHWRLVGQIQDPVFAFEELELDALDGVIGFFRRQRWVDTIRSAGVMAVNLSNAIANTGLPSTGNDEEAIGRLGAQHLLERGFRQFGFFTHLGHWYGQRRLAGFREVIEGQAGRTCHVLDCRSSGAAIAPEIYEWLKQLPKPVGVMAANDWRAVHTIQAATELGLRVPDDVAVVGVDNDRWLTQMTTPALSSVEPDWNRVGYRAAELLDALMRGEAPSPQQWIKPIGLTSRASTDIVVTEDPVVARALAFIQARCAQPISVEDVLDALGVSRRTLENRLKHAIGLTPHAAISRARVERARNMLVQTKHSTDEIAQRCGFSNSNQFFIVFKRLTGLTPGTYRRRFGSVHL